MSDPIDRQAAVRALERKKDKNAKGDIAGFYNKIIQNDIDTLMLLPSAQPEVTEEEVKEYCRKRGLCIVDSALLKKYASAQPEHTSPCADCQEFDCYGCDTKEVQV